MAPMYVGMEMSILQLRAVHVEPGVVNVHACLFPGPLAAVALFSLVCVLELRTGQDTAMRARR